MAFDVSRLRAGERLAGGAAVLLFIDMFLTWYSVRVPRGAGALLRAAGVSPDVSAWGAFDVTDLFLLLVVVVTVALVVVTATQRAPALPVAASVIVTGLGSLAALLVLYRILNQPGPNDLVEVRFGAYLGLLLVLGIAAGGFMAMREEGTRFADARAQTEALIGRAQRPATGAGAPSPDAAPPGEGPPGSDPPAAPPSPRPGA